MVTANPLLEVIRGRWISRSIQILWSVGSVLRSCSSRGRASRSIRLRPPSRATAVPDGIGRAKRTKYAACAETRRSASISTLSRASRARRFSGGMRRRVWWVTRVLGGFLKFLAVVTNVLRNLFLKNVVHCGCCSDWRFLIISPPLTAKKNTSSTRIAAHSIYGSTSKTFSLAIPQQYFQY